jgi:hypothetical protein
LNIDQEDGGDPIVDRENVNIAKANPDVLAFNIRANTVQPSKLK